MPFDIDGARSAGYSDAEIADYLGSQQNFDVKKARSSGYSDKEVIDYLSAPAASTAPAPTPQPAATTAPPQVANQDPVSNTQNIMSRALDWARNEMTDAFEKNHQIYEKVKNALPSGDEITGKLQGSTLKAAGGLETLAANSLDNDNLYYAKLYEDKADKYENSGFYHGTPEDKQYVKSLRDNAAKLREMGQADLQKYKDDPNARPMSTLRNAGEKLIAAGEDTLETTQPKNPTIAQRAVLGAVGAIPTLASGAVGGIVGGPPGALAAMGTSTAAESYADVANNPNLSEEQKQDYALASAGIGTVFNALPVTKAMGAAPLVQRLLKSLAVNVPAQEANTIAQHALAQHAGVDSEWNDQQWSQAIIDSAIQAGVFSAGHALVGEVGPAKRAREDQQVQDMNAKRPDLEREMFPEKPAEPAAPEQVQQQTGKPTTKAESPPAPPAAPNTTVEVKPSEEGHVVHVNGQPVAEFPNKEEADQHAIELRNAIETGTVPSATPIENITKDEKPTRVESAHGTQKVDVLGQEVDKPATPTPAQAEAGNYKKPEVKWFGLPIKIENDKGSVRTGPVNEQTGQPEWQHEMTAHYGYFKGSKAADKEGVDVFMGDKPQAQSAYVIDQLTPDGRNFDEHKVVVGVGSEKEARNLYLSNYPDGWKGIGAVTKMSVPEFKDWLNSDQTQQPLKWQPPATGPVRSTAKPQPQHDSILEYLSKTKLTGSTTNGLNFRDLEREGLDPADMRAAKGHGIRRPFTSDGGSLDHAAEVLSEAGYPVNDENGNPDPRKLLDLIDSELRGNKTYSHSNANRFNSEEEKYLRNLRPVKEDELGGMSDDELDHRIEMLSKVGDIHDDAELDRIFGLREGKSKYGKQPDLFGDNVSTKNELKKLEREKDRRRNTGQESVETGKPDDLFSEAKHQNELPLKQRANLPSKSEIIKTLQEHGFTKLKVNPSRVFVAGSFASGKQHSKSDIDVVLEVGSDAKAAELQEAYRRKAADYFVKNNLTGVHDDVHPQWNGRRIDVYFVGNTDDEKRPLVELKDAGIREEKQTGSLIVQHNLSAEKLMHASRIGGLAVPSLAITKKGTPITGFGEITLLGDKNMANPKGYKGTQVFGADVYSPRYPSITYKLDSGALKRLNKWLAPYNDGRQIYGGEIKDIDDLTQLDAFKKFVEKTTGKNSNSYHERRAEAEELLRTVGAEEKIFRGYNNNGDRKYVPHTLDNVVKILKKDIRGGESFNYGVGSLRAHFTPKFTSFKQIKDKERLLVTPDEFKKIKDEVDKEFWSLVDKLKPYYKYDSNRFGFGDTVISTLQDTAKKGMSFALNDYGFNDVPNDVKQSIADYLNKLRNLPTEYFEGIIPRAVGLDEFKAAVVPHDTDQKVLDQIKRHGLAVHTYNSNDQKSRVEAINKAAESIPEGIFERGQKYGNSAPLFYSALTRAAESAKITKGDAQQWLSTLKNMPGVKQEEIDAVDLAEFLGDRKGVTKQEVTEYLKNNGVNVTETILGNDQRMADLEDMARHGGLTRAQHDEYNDLIDKGTKFDKYVTPGGTGYRELLLTLPSKPMEEMRAAEQYYETFIRKGGEPLWNDLSPEQRNDIAKNMADVGRRATSSPEFHSSHWDQPNVLAHIRFDVRTGADGKKVMHIAEVQSDWHQKGRRSGYKLNSPELKKLEEKRDALWPAAADVIKRNDMFGFDTPSSAISAFLQNGDWQKRWDVSEEDARPIQNYLEARTEHTFAKHRQGDVPDAPFKTTWPELAMKRAIRWAVDHDIDRITWDTGETQADRYDLSKTLESLEWESRDGSEFELQARTDSGSPVSMFRTRDELADAVGKEMAEKISSQFDAGKKSGKYTGLDLKIGGEGMRGFYDQILPAKVNKLIKKWGSSVQLNNFNIGATSKQPELDTLGPQAHGFDITPAMRADASKGLAIFEAQQRFNFGDPYDHIPVRPDITERDKQIGRKSLKEVEQRIFGNKTGIWKNANLLGSLVTSDLKKRGFVSYIGQTINEPADLAKIAQAARETTLEQFRLVFTDANGKVIDEAHYGSRLAAAVAIDSEKILVEVRKRMAANGAKHYWMTHNHPSGNSSPSPADVRFTRTVSTAVPGFQEHVITDHDEYSHFNFEGGIQNGRDRVWAPELKSLDLSKNPEKPHELLNTKINDPESFIEAAKKLASSKDMVTIIGTTPRGQISFVTEVPFTDLDHRGATRMKKLRGVAAMKRALQRTGAAGYTFGVIPGETHYESTQRANALKGLGLFAHMVDYQGNELSEAVPDLYDVFGGRPTAREKAAGLREEGSEFYAKLKKQVDMFKDEKNRRSNLGKLLNAEEEHGRRNGKGPAGYRHARQAIVGLHHSEFIAAFRRLLNPAGMSKVSGEVANMTRAALGTQAQQREQAIHEMEKYAIAMDKLSPSDKLAMIDAIERGRPQPISELQPAADVMRKMLDAWREKVQSLGEGYLENWIDNYFPHYWQQEDAATKFIRTLGGRRPLRGPATFLKKRTIPYTLDGIQAGLKPLSVNPLVLTFLKIHEMQRFYTGVKLMQHFKATGLARFLKAGSPMPEGWTEIKDAVGRVRQWSEHEGAFIDRGRYIMPEDAARVINNHLSSSALQKFLPAQVFRAMSNGINALQLSFSGFHLGFTTLDAIISKNALAIERLFHVEPGRAAAAFLEGLSGPGAAAMNLRRGYQLMKAYANPGDATPQLQQIVRGLMAAGGKPKMDTYFLASSGQSPFKGVSFYSLARDIKDAMSQPHGKGQALIKSVGSFPLDYATKVFRELQAMGHEFPAWQIPFEIAGRVMRASTAIIMEHIVPMQKMGVFSDLAADYFRRNPNASPTEVNAAMQKIWNSVDNRLGEMVYDNVFWNRTFKDSLHFSIRAVGWNLGTLREIGGAPVDVLKIVDKAVSEGKVKAEDLGHKIPYVVAMTITTMVFGAMLTYLLTGKGPQDVKDYFFPRTGGRTKYGTPQRVSLPSYAKDVYEYAHEPGQTAINKLNPIYSIANQIWNNEDFFGNTIYEPEAGTMEKTRQLGDYLGRSALPFSLQSGKEIAGSEESGHLGTLKKVMPFVGLTVAPGRVSSPEEMERAKAAQQEESYVIGLRKRLSQAQEAGDDKKAEKLAEQLEAAKERASELRGMVNPGWFVPQSNDNPRNDPVVIGMQKLGIHKMPPQHVYKGVELTASEYQSLKDKMSAFVYPEMQQIFADPDTEKEMNEDPDSLRNEINERWKEAIKFARDEWLDDHPDIERRTDEKKEQQTNKPLRDLHGAAAPIRSVKDKQERVAMLRESGSPALANLVNSLPVKPRSNVLRALQNFNGEAA